MVKIVLVTVAFFQQKWNRGDEGFVWARTHNGRKTNRTFAKNILVFVPLINTKRCQSWSWWQIKENYTTIVSDDPLVDKADFMCNNRSNHSRLTLVMFMRKWSCIYAFLEKKKETTTKESRVTDWIRSKPYVKHRFTEGKSKNQLLKLVLKQG